MKPLVHSVTIIFKNQGEMTGKIMRLSLLVCIAFISCVYSTSDPYKTLQVSPTDDIETIRRAYRHAARQYHPDRNHDPNANEQFQNIANAFDTISKKKAPPPRTTTFVFRTKPAKKSTSPTFMDRFHHSLHLLSLLFMAKPYLVALIVILITSLGFLTSYFIQESGF